MQAICREWGKCYCVSKAYGNAKEILELEWEFEEKFSVSLHFSHFQVLGLWWAVCSGEKTRAVQGGSRLRHPEKRQGCWKMHEEFAEMWVVWHTRRNCPEMWEGTLESQHEALNVILRISGYSAGHAELPGLLEKTTHVIEGAMKEESHMKFNSCLSFF